MSNIDFFSIAGCFVFKKFLTLPQSKQLIAEASTAEFAAAKIVDPLDDSVYLSEDYRKTKAIKTSKATRVELYEKILALKPEIERHFDLALEGCEVPQILMYQPGDFFKVHRDQDTNGKTRTKDRKVSAVLFLNEQTTEPRTGSYCGGSLNLYGLFDGPGWGDKGFPLGGQAGLLIAFRSHLLHEVTPVSHGKRFTIVNWFY
jgi:SM-20-related protein